MAFLYPSYGLARYNGLDHFELVALVSHGLNHESQTNLFSLAELINQWRPPQKISAHSTSEPRQHRHSGIILHRTARKLEHYGIKHAPWSSRCCKQRICWNNNVSVVCICRDTSCCSWWHKCNLDPRSSFYQLVLWILLDDHSLGSLQNLRRPFQPSRV